MMENILIRARKTMEIGQAIAYQNLCIFPLLGDMDTDPNYLSMKTALEKQQIEIREVDESGSVPDLKVINHSDLPVLILNGEEVAGAKQNRVVNTSILIPAKKELLIPVSCTEQGRWSYNSKTFSDSGVILSEKARGRSHARVSAALKEERGYDAAQGEVWKDVRELHERGRTHSRTQAMKDAYELKKEQMEDYLQAFPLQKKQKGIIVFRNGELTGMDYVSRSSAYEAIHNKLLKSHVIEAIAELKALPEEDRLAEKARAFLDGQLEIASEQYDAVGLGSDYRMQSESCNASILTYEEQVVHWTAYPDANIMPSGRNLQ